MPSCAQGAGRAVTCTAVVAAPECGMWGAYMARMGYPHGQKGSCTGHVTLGERPRQICSLPVAGGEVPQARREARGQWAMGTERGKASWGCQSP